MVNLKELFDATADLRMAESGQVCSPGERVEFMLVFVRMAYAKKLEYVVAEGAPASAALCESIVGAFSRMEKRFADDVRNGASKDVAAARIFKRFNTIDAASKQGDRTGFENNGKARARACVHSQPASDE